MASALLAGLLLALPNLTDESAVSSPPASPAAIEQVAKVQPNGARAAEARVVRRPDSVLQTPALGGMVVGIDPETGKLGMPTQEQLEELSGLGQPEVDHSSEGLVEVHHPDGSVSVDLQGRFQEFATVRIGPGGKLIFQCVDGAENAERAVMEAAEDGSPGGAAGPAPAAEER